MTKKNKFVWNGVSYGDRSSWEKAKWADPSYRKRILKSKRKFNNSKRGKKVLDAWHKSSQTKEAKKKRSKSLKKHWKKNYKRRYKIAKRNIQYAIEVSRKNWKDPKYYKRMCKVRKNQVTAESKIENGKRVKSLWLDPDYRKRQMRSRKKSKAYKNRFKKVSATLKRRYASGKIKVWNKGLTKKTHKSLKAASEKFKGKIPDYNKYRCHYVGGDNGTPHCIRMRSRWEVIFAKWLDKNNVTWQYEPKHFHIGESSKWTGTTFTPDFYIPKSKIYVEVKGYASKEFWRKMIAFHKRYPDKRIIIMDKKEKFKEMLRQVMK